MNTLFRVLWVFFCLCLWAWISATPVMAEVSCKKWNTDTFFRRASVADVSRCLKTGADINARNKYKNTPLHFAASTNNPAVMTTLLKAGADINARDKDNSTPLHGAATFNDNLEVITTLLKAGADINARDKFKRAPLHYAAWSNDNLAIITTLLKAGADINARAQGKETPLHYAAELRDENPAVITALVAAGADLNARNLNRETARQLAASRDKNKSAFVAAFSEEAVAAFREKERKARAAADRRRMEERLKAARVSCEKWNTSGFFRHADAADVSRCLQKKSDPKSRNKYGETPLHMAAKFSEKPEVVAVLKKAGADLRARDKKGRTPLHTAAVFGKTPEAVTALINAGADLSAKDKRGRTPLEFAQKFSRTPAVVAVLQKASARMGPVERRKMALRVSCAKWNTPGFFQSAGLSDLSRCLKTKNPNARNKIGRTPLHYAAQGDAPALVSVLVKAGADLNAKDTRGGWTPLHLAAWFGKTPAVVKALLEAGADPAARDKAGKTPWDYAERNAALKDTDVYRRLNEGRFR